MIHSLQARLAELRLRVRRLVWLYGLGGTVAVGVAALLLLGLVDYRVRLEDPGLRVMASLALWGIVGWSVYRLLYRPLAARLADVELARQVERAFPELGDRLRSAVEFVDQPENDRLAGSPALRRAAIAATVAETDRVDFAGILDTRPARRAAMLGSCAVLLAAIVVLLDPWSSGVAVARLVNPFGSAAWPRQTQLVLKNNVERMARGQAFEVEVSAVAGTRLPDEARIDYRFDNDDGSTTAETDALRRLSDVLVARRENVQRSFAFRIEGGDDRSMSWQRVEVVAPPQLESLRVDLQPPAYTGWPMQTSDGAIRALVGTRVKLTAAVNKPLQSATIHWGDEQTLPATVSADRRRFEAPAAGELIVEEPGAYWIELIDEEGIEAGREAQWEIRAVPDAAPSVVIEQPSANLFVTPQATVALRIAAKDDLALREVALIVGRSDRPDAEEQRELWRSQRIEGAAAAGEPLAAGEPVAGEGEQRLIEYRWDLSTWGFEPGIEVTFAALAADELPQTTRSEPRRLTIITPQQLLERLAARQSALVAELERVLKMQRACRAEVDAVGIRVAQLGAAEQADIDRMQAAELSQRQVSRTLTSRGDGVAMQLLAMLADLANNKVDSPDIQRRMEAMLAEIERLERAHLPLIGPALVSASKQAQVRLQSLAAPRDGATAAALATAAEHQDAVIESLETMLADLNQWDSYRRFHREISQLLREQEDLNRRTSETGLQTLTHALAELTPPQQADLRVLGGRQLEYARRLDRTLGEMQQSIEPLRSIEPLAADLLQDAYDEGRRLATSGKMRSAGRDVYENQVGRVLVVQQEIAGDLQELLDILANRKQQELDRLVRKLQQAERDLAALEAQQAAVAQGLAKPAAGDLPRLADEQQRVQEEADRMARRLERLAAQQSGDAVAQAATEMGAAREAAGGGDAAGSAQRAEAARKKLADAQRRLAAERLRAQAELATEQLARLEDAVKHLRQQQHLAIEETKRLEGLRTAKGALSRAQETSLNDLARQQRALQSETAAMGDSLQGARAFQLALAAAARDMGQAASRLERRSTDAATGVSQARALGRLDMLLEALKPEAPDDDNENQNDNGGAGDNPGAGQQPGGVRTLAELKMLKLLQVEINQRTAEVQSDIDDKPTAEQQRELAALAAEQSQLSDLVLEMLVPVEDKEEEP